MISEQRGFKAKHYLEIESKNFPPNNPVEGCFYTNKNNSHTYVYIDGEWRELIDHNTVQTLSNKKLDRTCTIEATINAGDVNCENLNVAGDIIIDGYVDGVDISELNQQIQNFLNSGANHSHNNKFLLDKVDQDLSTNSSIVSFNSLTILSDTYIGGGLTVGSGLINDVNIVDLRDTVLDHIDDTTKHHSHNNKNFLDQINQNLSTSGSPSYQNLTLSGNITVAGLVDGVDISTFYSAYGLHVTSTGIGDGSKAHHSHTNWTNLQSINQNLSISDNVNFNRVQTNEVQVNGNILVTGTVDGVDVSTMKQTLDTHLASSGPGNSNVHHLHTNWLNLQSINQNLSTTDTVTFGNIVTPGLVDGVDISTFKVDYDTHKADSGSGLSHIHHTHNNWSNLNSINQDLTTTSTVTFGNIITSGLVDGVDVSALPSQIGTVQNNLNSHISDSSIHFTQSQINHNNIQNRGTYSHSEIDQHLDDDELHGIYQFSCESTVNVRDCVYVDNGIVKKASATQLSTASTIGFVVEKINSNVCKIKTAGKITGFSGLTPGQTVLLGRVPGTITQTAVGFFQDNIVKRIAKALTTNDIFLLPEAPAVILSVNR